MLHDPTEQEVQAFIRDYEQDFGVTIPHVEAHRILVLYEELCEFFERYNGDAFGFEAKHLQPSKFVE